MAHRNFIASHWRLIVRLLVFGVPLFILAIWYGRTIGKDWEEMERWIAELGIWGPIVLVLAAGILTVAFCPDTPFSMVAGALFGLTWGTVYALAGAVLGATLTFWISRLLLRHRVSSLLERHPRWSAIERAASREGTRLQLLVRLTPMHSAVFSYVMGASGLPYRSFAVGCLAMTPVVFVEVYFGYLAGHVANLASGAGKPSAVRIAVTIAGLLLGVVAMLYVARLARRAIAESQREAELPVNSSAVSTTHAPTE